jgi:hypothetical protein
MQPLKGRAAPVSLRRQSSKAVRSGSDRMLTWLRILSFSELCVIMHIVTILKTAPADHCDLTLVQGSRRPDHCEPPELFDAKESDDRLELAACEGRSLV